MSVTGLVLLISIATSGVSGFLIIGGLVALGTAVFSLITGRASWARLPSRRIAAVTVAASIVALVVGSALAPPKADIQSFVDAPVAPADNAAPEAPKPTPRTTSAPKPTATPTRSPSATPTPEPTTIPAPAPVADAPVAPVAPVPIAAPIAEAPAPPPPAPAPAAPSCDPNYSGACVPVASDVDCAGGSGNGPAYVAGPVYVVGSDIYELDRDGDGIACD